MIFEVVINTCFGGFDLSNEAKRMLAERKGMTINEVEMEYIFCRSDDYQPRSCPDLIAVVKELDGKAGDEGYGYDSTRLEIVLLKDEYGRFAIDDYDGQECAYTPAMQQWAIALNNHAMKGTEHEEEQEHQAC